MSSNSPNGNGETQKSPEPTNITSDSSGSPSNWNTLLNSTVVAALVTVAVGGWWADNISSTVQKNAQLFETRLAAHKEQLDAANKIVEWSYKMVGDIIGAADMLTKAEEKVGSKGKRDESYKEIHANYLEKVKAWESGKKYAAYLMSFYYHTDAKTELIPIWNELESNIDGYIECWHMKRDEPCKLDRNVKDLQLKLLVALAEAQKKSWQQIMNE